jgi:transcriptional regulator with XRE-family HTH domain
MMHAAALVDALKRALKARGITYARLAQALGLSEASVKRMFSRRDFTLERLDEVCRVAGVDVADLVQDLLAQRPRVSRLSVEQERELVADVKLLLVALCATGNWTLEQIVAAYDITREECIGHLVHLDRLELIELGPGNRIRSLLTRTFSWQPDGPVQRYFRTHIEAEYLDWGFDGPGELLLFVNGMLSRASLAELGTRLRRVAGEFADLHIEDTKLPLAQRHGASLLLAVRPFEPREFRALRRRNQRPLQAGRLLDIGFVRSLLGPKPPSR